MDTNPHHTSQKELKITHPLFSTLEFSHTLCESTVWHKIPLKYIDEIFEFGGFFWVFSSLILFTLQTEKWNQLPWSSQQRYLSCSSIHQCVWVSMASVCLRLCVNSHCGGTATGDLFIWLLPSKLACPLDRWPLCPDSRGPVSLSGTQQLEGQLSGDSIYSYSLFLLSFTFSIPLPPLLQPSLSITQR